MSRARDPLRERSEAEIRELSKPLQDENISKEEERMLIWTALKTLMPVVIAVACSFLLILLLFL